MNNKICIFFIKGIFFSLILILFSCSMNSKSTDKVDKINNVIFSVNKNTNIKIKE